MEGRAFSSHFSFCNLNCLPCLLLSCRLTVLTFHAGFQPHISGLTSWKIWHYYDSSQSSSSASLFPRFIWGNNESENWWWQTQLVVCGLSSRAIESTPTPSVTQRNEQAPNSCFAIYKWSKDSIIIFHQMDYLLF